MVRRTGVTLVEVLVAIFVVAIGLLSLLTLFPLGAFNMAQAIKDNRTGQIAANAAAYARFMNVRTDANLIAAWDLSTNAMTDYPAPASGGPSYPVYVDPFGLRFLGGVGLPGNDYRLGTQNSSATPYTPATPVRRVTLSTITPATQNYLVPRWFSLLDELVFGPDGVPNPRGTSLIERGGRYSWAFFCQEVRAGDSTRVNLSVVVYDRRPIFTSSNGVMPTQLAAENIYLGNLSTKSTLVTVTWDPATQPPPPVQRGGWILDATGTPPHGYFYRVVAFKQPGSNGPNSVDVELQTNPRADATNGLIVVMEGVAEVFDMGQS